MAILASSRKARVLQTRPSFMNQVSFIDLRLRVFYSCSVFSSFQISSLSKYWYSGLIVSLVSVCGLFQRWSFWFDIMVIQGNKKTLLWFGFGYLVSLLRYLTGFLRIFLCIIMLSILSGGISGNERKKGLHRIVFMVIILPMDNKMLVIEWFVQMLVLLVLLDKVTFALESYYQNGEEWFGWGTCKRKHIILRSVNIFRLQVQSYIRVLVFNCRFFCLVGRL